MYLVKITLKNPLSKDHLASELKEFAISGVQNQDILKLDILVTHIASFFRLTPQFSLFSTHIHLSFHSGDPYIFLHKFYNVHVVNIGWLDERLQKYCPATDVPTNPTIAQPISNIGCGRVATDFKSSTAAL